MLINDTEFIVCPCQKCLNVVEFDGLDKLQEHLVCEGNDKPYTCWTYYGAKKGERRSSNLNSNHHFTDRVDTKVFGDTKGSNVSDKNEIPNDFNEEELRDHPDMHEKLKDNATLPLWPGCTKFSKLSAVLTLHNLKVGHQVSGVFFTQMLIAVSELLPDGNILPRRTYEAKQMLISIGLVHERNHAYPDDFILYRRSMQSLTNVPSAH